MIGHVIAFAVGIFALCLVVVGVSAPTRKNRDDALRSAAILATVALLVAVATKVLT